MTATGVSEESAVRIAQENVLSDLFGPPSEGEAEGFIVFEEETHQSFTVGTTDVDDAGELR